jgi:hypothetical protein
VGPVTAPEQRIDVPGPSREPICFVACVESGPLEAQTVRLAESLRRFGGSLRDSELLAVTARFGPPLSSATRRRFRELGVRHERVAAQPGYGWFHYLNKPLALAAAEQLTDAPLIAWLDSDIVLLGEPAELRLADGIDFAAAVPDNGVVGSTGPESPHDADWRRLCELFGVEADALPWVTTDMEHERIRLYFNSGVFSYRRGIGFSSRYLEMCTAALDARFGFAHNGPHFVDQVCLGLALHTAALRWKRLPFSHNFPIASFLPEPPGLEDAVILHYHDAMGPHHYATVLERLHATHPDVHAWLSGERPLTDPAPLPSRVLREALRVARGVPRRRYRLRMQTA